MKIIEVIKNIDSKAKPRDLEKAINKILPSNRDERDSLLAGLGIVGILETEKHKGFYDSFKTISQREHPQTSEWDYPIVWWRGKDGINQEVFNFYFGHYDELKQLIC